jgi:hypothetical protein
MDFSGYFTTLLKDGKIILNSLGDRSNESFTNTNDGISALGIVFGILILIFLLLSAGGAASLSWNYNMFIRTSGGLSFFYAILAFLFPGFYYPFYAFFLNPVANLTRTMTPNLRGINNLNKRQLIAALRS